MRMRCFLVLLLLFSGLQSVGFAQNEEQSNNDSDRKILRKTIPRYPEIAKKMNLAGTVKVLAIITPDGKVKAVQPVGGSPLLIQAAEDAISQWKYAPAGGESKEIIELHFSPQ
jgi:TonB family protein